MVKTKLKQILLIFMLLVMAVCFCACGEINSMIITNDNGSIEEIVTITLDNEEILNKGYSVNQLLELKNSIKAEAKNQAKNMKDNLNAKIDLQLLTTTDKDTIKTLQSYYNGISAFEGEEENVYSIKVVFKDINVYKYYYGISETSKAEMKEEKHFFYNKVYWYGSTMYIKHRGLCDAIKTVYEEKYSDLINHNEGKLTYTYVCDLRREHSNADYITKGEDFKYYHTWVIDKENATEQTIMFYYNVANQTNCILVCLAITFGVALILGIVAITLHFVKKKNRKE